MRSLIGGMTLIVVALGPAVAAAESWVLWEGRGPTAPRTISVHDGKAACLAAARGRLKDDRALELTTPPGYRLEVLDKNGLLIMVLTAQCWPVGVTPQ